MKAFRLARFFLGGLCTVCLSSVLAAQDELPTDLTELTVEQLMNITVTAATKISIPQMEVPQAVTVLTRSDIERTPAQTLGDVLRTLPGANVVRTQSSQNILSVRGSNPFAPSKILILIDGQPVVPTLFSTTWWDLLPVNIADIEKIEFVRSPGTIYGADAQNGVVNIVTRRLAADGPSHQEFVFEGKIGQQNLRQGYVGYLGNHRGISYRLSSQFADKVNAYFNPERLELIPGKLSGKGEQTFDQNRNQLDLQTFSGSLETKLFGNDLTAGAGVTRIENAQGRIPDRLCFVGLDGYLAYAHLKYSFPALGMTNTISAESDLTNYRFVRNSDTEELAPAGMFLRRIKVGYEARRGWGRSHKLLAGFGYSTETGTADAGSLVQSEAEGGFSTYRTASRLREGGLACGGGCSQGCSEAQSLAYQPASAAIDPRRLPTTNVPATRASNPAQAANLVFHPVENEPAVNVYVQDEWRVSKKGTLYYGGLFSHHYVSGSTFAPMLAYVHKLNLRNSLRMGTFTSYRNPNVFEHSLHYDQITGASSKRTHLDPNRDLAAERTTSYEIGFRSQATKRFFLTADAYINQVRDGVEWTLVGVLPFPTSRPTYRSENTLTQTIRGMETTSGYQFNKNFSLENNLTLTTISSRSRRPEYQGNDGHGPLRVGQGRYGSQYVPPYIDHVSSNFDWNPIHATVQYQYTGAHQWQWPTWNPDTGKDQFALKPVRAYGLLNLYAGIDLRRNYRVAIEAYNLLNNRHTEWRGDESYFGRAVRAKVQITLGRE